METHQFESLRHEIVGLRERSDELHREMAEQRERGDQRFEALHREIVEQRERSDQQFERLLHEIVELRGYTDRGLRGLREEVHGWVEDARRHFHVLEENLRGEIQLLAEGVAAVNERLDRVEARLEAKMDRRFDETHALIRSSYHDLDRRVTTLEGSAPS